MTLSPEQLALFYKQGFLVLKQFTSAERCDAILAVAKKHLDEKIEPIESEEEYSLEKKDSMFTTVRRLRQVYDRHELFKEWMTDEKMRPVLKQILGEKPTLLLAHHNSIMTKLPQVSSVTFWHQDIRYWHYETDELLSVWLSLGDEYLENGLLEFIPGSHKMTFSPEQFDEKSTFKDDHPLNIDLLKTRVHTKLSKGDVVLFHAKTLHYASINSTDQAKVSFVYSLKAHNNKALAKSRSDFKELELS